MCPLITVVSNMSNAQSHFSKGVAVVQTRQIEDKSRGDGMHGQHASNAAVSIEKQSHQVHQAEAMS